MNFQEIKERANGQWAVIYNANNIDVGEGKHQPCPACRGTDRFRYDDKNGNGDYYCNNCGPGDGFSLLQKHFNISFPDAVKKVAEFLNVEFTNEKNNSKDTQDPRVMLRQLWAAGQKLTGGDPVSKYLHGRSISLTPDNVRYCPECYESETKRKYPAMVALIHDTKGDAVGIHRTYLADVPTKKKMMPSLKPLNGSCVRLNRIENQMFNEDKLGIAEGIETALSVSQCFHLACWATLSTSLMEKWEPPVDCKIRHFIIFGDTDINFAGAKAAYTLAHKLAVKDYIVELNFPISGDWNDYLIGRKED
jgi:putative DNA primase/helicase